MQADFIIRIQNIDRLIRIKGTGTPDEFAERLGISRRCLYDCLNKMKSGGAPIKYDHYRSTFFYAEEGSFKIDFSFSRSRVGSGLRSVASYAGIYFVLLAS